MGFAKQGLYDPAHEHDSCGVGFVATVSGQASHEIVSQALEVLKNLAHRGATGADPLTSDGAGILLQIPHEFLGAEAAQLGFSLPDPGHYGVGMVFLPVQPDHRIHCEGLVERFVRAEGLDLLGWRRVPVHEAALGPTARDLQPHIRQIFVGGGAERLTGVDLERRLYLVRKQVERVVRESSLGDFTHFHFPSFSTRTLIYKGLLMAHQLAVYYPDLAEPAVKSKLALVHQRYSTNTFPTWDLAQPFRMLAHNGEINTVKGNARWIQAREAVMESQVFGENLPKLYPVITPKMSDSAVLDNVLEFLVANGRDLPHALMMLVPEAWQSQPDMDPDKRAFYQYHACLMEPWDGPAAIAFTDGRYIGGILDRNGLRPSRYVITTDGLVILASEAGVLEIPPARIARKWRLQPGKMFLVDTEAGRVIGDAEIKAEIVRRHPYADWVKKHKMELADLPMAGKEYQPDHTTILTRQRLFGYSLEDIRMILKPMAENGEEPVGSMGTDIPLAVLSQRPRLLYDYFKQSFAQVTNPPIDPIREALVMSLESYTGNERNILDENPGNANMLRLPHPILTNVELEKLRHVTRGGFRTAAIPMLFKGSDGEAGLRKALAELCELAAKRVAAGYSFVILSDRGVSADLVPIPTLLAISAVHNYLIERGLRVQSGLVLETGEAREVAHFALLIGFGASAINPYLAFETLADLALQGEFAAGLTHEAAVKNYIKAIEKGLLKIFSKMGISTLQSYRGAQIFEAIGLSHEVTDEYFRGTLSRLGGVSLDVIAKEAVARHAEAYPERAACNADLDPGGIYQYRARGEYHLFNPQTIAKLQDAVRQAKYGTYKEYAELVNNQSRHLATLRGLFAFKPRRPVPLEEVEPVSAITRRFCTGAMSFGSISAEAHETLAIAMNRIGGRSNTGEGGEDPARFVPLPSGDSKNSAIKQIASARFGVTSEYLASAREIQIKMAQGAKPGEGGQLPGHKVDATIARVRYSTPGVTLISPPPHHDIYSIEDLAQLIYDLKNVNPAADVSVKLVSEAGVGTVAAGVAKAKADLVLISGHDGGTGASPLTSIQHAGMPWELGLAETQQVLVLNNLRGRIRVQVDGQIKTGRDVVIGALLGAEEFGFATTALVSMGCIMMRKCHLNTCPVGIATQDPRLRGKFAGRPEEVVKFFEFVATEAREIMASLGFRALDEMIGRVDCLDVNTAIHHWKSRGLDLEPILMRPLVPERIAVRRVTKPAQDWENALDMKLIELARPAIDNQLPVSIQMPIRNIHRAVGAMLGGVISKRYGGAGLPPDTIKCTFQGSAGQSFGAWAVRGMTLALEGEANDYAGKGLSGGVLAIFPPAGAPWPAHENIIAGNTVLYGATGGEAYFAGVAGERFAVRNSGAIAVVEGAGDHCCEYMTRGAVVVLGPTGRNFAAGMSGGFAYVHDGDGQFRSRCNLQMVEIEPLADTDDSDRVRDLIGRHVEMTGSKLGREILARWDNYAAKFVRVTPLEYRRATSHAAAGAAHG